MCLTLGLLEESHFNDSPRKKSLDSTQRWQLRVHQGDTNKETKTTGLPGSAGHAFCQPRLGSISVRNVRTFLPDFESTWVGVGPSAAGEGVLINAAN